MNELKDHLHQGHGVAPENLAQALVGSDDKSNNSDPEDSANSIAQEVVIFQFFQAKE